MASLDNVTVVDCALVSIFTVLWSVDHSLDCIASSDCASVWVGESNWGEEALSSCCITNSFCAFVSIITSDWSVLAFSVDCSISCAEISVVTVERSENTSLVSIASINSVCVVVIASDCCVLASSVCIASVGCACILVVTVLCSVLASSVNTDIVCARVGINASGGVETLSIDAFVKSASVVVITVHWGVDASLL